MRVSHFIVLSLAPLALSNALPDSAPEPVCVPIPQLLHLFPILTQAQHPLFNIRQAIAPIPGLPEPLAGIVNSVLAFLSSLLQTLTSGLDAGSVPTGLLGNFTDAIAALKGPLPGVPALPAAPPGLPVPAVPAPDGLPALPSPDLPVPKPDLPAAPGFPTPDLPAPDLPTLPLPAPALHAPDLPAVPALPAVGLPKLPLKAAASAVDPIPTAPPPTATDNLEEALETTAPVADPEVTATDELQSIQPTGVLTDLPEATGVEAEAVATTEFPEPTETLGLDGDVGGSTEALGTGTAEGAVPAATLPAGRKLRRRRNF